MPCKHHAVSGESGEVGEEAPSCMTCQRPLKATAAKLCSNTACKAACCRAVGLPCRHHKVSSEAGEEAPACITLRYISVARMAITEAVTLLVEAIERDWLRTSTDIRTLDKGFFCA
jgi:hypothetical protein